MAGQCPQPHDTRIAQSCVWMRILSGVAGDQPCPTIPATSSETIEGAAAPSKELTGQCAPDQGIGPDGQVNVALRDTVP
jgi:hypothetical protein